MGYLYSSVMQEVLFDLLKIPRHEEIVWLDLHGIEKRLELGLLTYLVLHGILEMLSSEY
jgi:hypothetical protein